MTEAAPDRRPIRARSLGVAKSLAGWLVKRGITPNQISLAGLGYAAMGALVLGLAGLDWSGRPALYLIGTLMIELRLLCNMLDGMVAVEGGKGTAAGPLYNEMPDRLADSLLLIGAGCSIGSFTGVVLGFVAALLAILTAYVRALGSSLSLPSDFSGPMAKPHRMQALAITCVIAAAVSTQQWDRALMITALVVIILGTGFTVARRLKHAYDGLARKP